MSAALLSTTEAAELLGVSRHTVVRYIKAGALPAAPLPEGSPYRIPRQAIDAMIAPPAAPRPAPAAPAEVVAFAPRSARAQAAHDRRRGRAA